MRNTGFYYYGARYYNPRESLWLSVDPLADYNPVMNDEHYIDGQHNGGVFNSGNLNSYGYCYQSPVKWYDPNGKQAIAVHGTWSNNSTWKNQKALNTYVNKVFGNKLWNYQFQWSGANYSSMRTEAAIKLVKYIIKMRTLVPKDEPLTLIGHSHGGNVDIEAINIIVKMKEFDNVKINLLTINTPVRKDYQLSEEAKKRVNHVNIYDENDPVQSNGGNSAVVLPDLPATPKFMNTKTKGTGEYGNAGRTFRNTTNIKVNNPQGCFGDFHNSHNRTNDWIYKIKK